MAKNNGDNGNGKNKGRKKLTPRQEKFIEEYLKLDNATQAAINAGYSAKTARKIAAENLTKPVIEAKIQRRRQELAKNTITPEWVLERYKEIAGANMKVYSRWGPGGVTLKDSDELTEEEAAAVSEVSQATSKYGSNVKFKLHDKVKALDSIAKTLGMFVEKHEHSGGGGGPIELVFVSEKETENPANPATSDSGDSDSEDDGDA